jgi:type IV secretion system protein VirD4
MEEGFWLGQEWDWRTGRAGKPVIYSDNRHVTLFGPTRSGKGVSIEIPNLLRLGGDSGWGRRGGDVSVLSLDSKAQNCAVTMKWRARFSTVWVLNPFNVLGIPSTGFNPLLRLDPRASRLFDQAQGIADVLIVTGRNESQPHFAESARALLIWLIMWEVIDAARRGRVPSLAHVRDLLTEPVETSTDAAGNEYEVKGLRATAGRAVASGDLRITGLAGRFVGKSKELDGIISTADTQTRWLMSAPMREDISVREGADFSRLRREPITCYVCLPAHALEAFNPWLKLVVTSALNTIYEQGGTGGHRVVMMLSEYANIAAGGELKPITAALAQGAGYGIQLAPIVLQDINQLRAIHGRDQAETFLGMSGATVAFAPNDGMTAEWMSVRSGDRRYAGLSASDDPSGANDARMSYQEKRERRIPPDAMYGIPPFHGLAWFAGQSAPLTVWAPPYWEIPELRGRYSRDPYHQ